MAEEEHEVRSIHWGEVFSFTHIFKGFVMARDPGKLVLSAVALVLMFLCGLVMDRLWGACGSYVRTGEVAAFACCRAADNTPVRDFNAWLGEQNGKRLADAAQLQADVINDSRDLTGFRSDLTRLGGDSNEFQASLLRRLDEYNKDKKPQQADAATILDDARKNKASWSSVLDDAQAAFAQEVAKIETVAMKKAADDAAAEVKSLQSDHDQAKAALDKATHLAEQALAQAKSGFSSRLRAIRGERISGAFVNYEWDCIRGAIAAVRYGNITTGLKDYYQGRVGGVSPLPLPTASYALPSAAPQDDPPGFLCFCLLAYRGLLWMLCTHWLYGTIYVLAGLAVAALFGGAVHRMAAVQFAREEKISMRQGLQFSASKFLSFFTAPLLPILIIVVLGVVLAIGGFLFGTWAGGILLGALLAIGIVLGLAVAFLVVGLVAGGPLMYPTIAVEGSDSFDAISRSFSYVFSRPWSAILYGLVAAVYGAITYTFVRLFAYLALAATHYFLRWGVFPHGNALSPSASKLDVIWTAPTFDSLWGSFNWAAMSGMEKCGAFLIGVWVFLVAVMVSAYLLSYTASVSSVIYYLLRRAVDATDLDDVYVEEPAEKTEEPVGVPAEPSAPAAATEPPPPPPPAATAEGGK